jgi:GntR family transcriptional regulator, gluconate operon transcriptional repressor
VSRVITPIRKEVFADQIATGLRDRIIEGVFLPGERLVEETLASQFGVSRGPVRDALKRLEVEGLVEFRQPGVHVIGIGLSDIDELYTLRGAIETTALALAMKRASAADWDGMRVAIREMNAAAEAGEPGRFSSADVCYHNLIHTLSGHRRLNDIWKQYVPVLAALQRRTVFTDRNLLHTAGNHQRLYDLIVRGDAPGADAELRSHLAESYGRMTAACRASLAAAV